jgi:hypothetical protein
MGEGTLPLRKVCLHDPGGMLGNWIGQNLALRGDFQGKSQEHPSVRPPADPSE